MNGFLAVGISSLIVHSPDGATWTQVHHEVAAQSLDAVGDDGAGNLVTGPDVTSFPANKLLVSHDDGLTWAAKLTAPVTLVNDSGGFTAFALGGTTSGAPRGSQSANIVYDGTRFALVGGLGSVPFIGMFSSDGGETWQVYGQTTPALPIYVPNDLAFFGGVYVGISANNPDRNSLIWSPTAGLGAGAIFPGTANDWVSGQVTNGVSSFVFFKTNGDYLLAFGHLDGGGDWITWKSTNGKTWTASAALNGLFVNNGKDSVWWDTTLALWVLVGGDNGGSGIFTSPDGLVWTARLYDATSTLAFNSVRRTGWFLSAVGNRGIFYISMDGLTWTAIDAACHVAGHWDLSFIHSISNFFVAHGFDNNSPFDEAIITSPDGINWTERYVVNVGDGIFNLIGPSGGDPLTSYINPCTGQPEFAPTTRTINGALIGFTFNEEQGVTAWHRHPMIGAVEAIACIPAPNKSQDDLG